MPNVSFAYLLLFVPTSVAVYAALRNLKQFSSAKVWLALVSIAFYAYAGLLCAALVCASLVVNFATAKWLYGSAAISVSWRRLGLWAAIGCNVALLGYFKYLNFFISSSNAIFGKGFPLQEVILPLGISFYTIQQIIFLVDSYEGLAEEPSFLNYVVFVTFFPKGVAGPIVHHSDLKPLLEIESPTADPWPDLLTRGILLVGIGLAKKVLIADNLAIWVKRGYEIPSIHFGEAWAVVTTYIFQIYFDFSGYSDIAIGIALLFGVTLPINFNRPLKATSLIAFWERWHISLTNFITTYIYMGLMRNLGRPKFVTAMACMLFAMTIAGLWHGPTWGFVLFGVLNGIGLIINHLWRRAKLPMPVPVGWACTMTFLCLSFVVFRADSLSVAANIYRGLLGLNGLMAKPYQVSLQWLLYSDFYTKLLAGIGSGVALPLMVSAVALVVLLGKPSQELVSGIKINAVSLIIGSVLCLISMMFIDGFSQFIYGEF